MKPLNLLTVIIRKELLDARRDKRSLSTLLLMVIMLPSILFFSLQAIIIKSNKVEQEEVLILVQNGAQAPTLLAELKQAGMKIEEVKDVTSASAAERLKDRKVNAVVEISNDYRASYDALRPAVLNLWYNSAKEDAGKVRKLRKVLQRYQQNIAAVRLIARGVSPSLVSPLELREYDVADQAERAGSFLGVMFGMLFWAVFAVSTTMIIDTTAGERERRTLELLMAQPVRAWQVICGKWLASSLFAFSGLALEMLITHFALRTLALEELGMSWQLGPLGLALIIFSGLPLALFASAFIMALAMNTKNFKEAQATVGIAMIIPMLPVMIVPMLDLGKQTWMYSLPVLGHSEVVKSITKGQQVLPLEWLLLLGTPTLAAFLLIAFCTWRMKSERFVVGI